MFYLSLKLQSEISLLEFQDAEPDILVFTYSELLKRFNRNYHDALQVFCKKKGLDAEVIQNLYIWVFKLFFCGSVFCLKINMLCLDGETYNAQNTC